MAENENNPQYLTNRAKKQITDAQDLKDLDDIFRSYLGKKGELTQLLRSLAEMSPDLRQKQGKAANDLRNSLQQDFERRKQELQTVLINESEKNDIIDITAPAAKLPKGHLHPLTHIQRKAQEIFQSMGFTIAEGPEIETEFYNFDTLNIPSNHPARDMWDTFWLKPKNAGFLLRTHTSPVQARYMEKNNPPLRIIVPGRCFRHEATDSSHDAQFYQVEGLVVDKDISMAHLKGTLEEFFSCFFEEKISIRLRPSYFPFVEPGFEIDMSCLVCEGRGCSVCSQSGWVEMMPGGSPHPNVLKTAGLDPHEWTGFYINIGLDRLAMMKYGIDDIRLFYNGDLRLVNQF